MEQWIDQLAGHKIIVTGDVVLDEYLIGRATRISREAPIPVLEYESRRVIPGGAANPAMTIATLSSQAYTVALRGDDAAGEQLDTILNTKSIHTGGLIIDPNRPTTLKTRLLAQMGLRFPQQVARMDRLSRQPITPQVETHLRHAVEAIASQADAILFSDYRAGLLTPTFIQYIRETQTDVILTADAQGELSKYTGFTLVKRNADEARDYLGRSISGDDEFATAARDLYQELHLKGAMVITRGAEGATLATASTSDHCPAPQIVDVFDTVGAGDTAIAVMTLAVVAGADYKTAVTLANYASGLVVRRVGNYAPGPDELREALYEDTP